MTESSLTRPRQVSFVVPEACFGRIEVGSTEAGYMLDGDRRPNGRYIETNASSCAEASTRLVVATDLFFSSVCPGKSLWPLARALF